MEFQSRNLEAHFTSGSCAEPHFSIVPIAKSYAKSPARKFVVHLFHQHQPIADLHLMSLRKKEADHSANADCSVRPSNPLARVAWSERECMSSQDDQAAYITHSPNELVRKAPVCAQQVLCPFPGQFPVAVARFSRNETL